MLTVPCIYYFYFSIPNPKIEDVIFFNLEMSLHCLTNDGQEKNCHLTIYDMIRQLMMLGPIHIWVWLILPIDFYFIFFIFFPFLMQWQHKSHQADKMLSNPGFF